MQGLYFIHKESFVARTNYQYEKRRKELAKKKKNEEKRERKLAKKGGPQTGEASEPVADGEVIPPDGLDAPQLTP